VCKTTIVILRENTLQWPTRNSASWINLYIPYLLTPFSQKSTKNQKIIWIFFISKVSIILPIKPRSYSPTKNKKDPTVSHKWMARTDSPKVPNRTQNYALKIIFILNFKNTTSLKIFRKSKQNTLLSIELTWKNPF
jgi:hypothetical protein